MRELVVLVCRWSGGGRCGARVTTRRFRIDRVSKTGQAHDPNDWNRTACWPRESAAETVLPTTGVVARPTARGAAAAPTAPRLARACAAGGRAWRVLASIHGPELGWAWLRPAPAQRTRRAPLRHSGARRRRPRPRRASPRLARAGLERWRARPLA